MLRRIQSCLVGPGSSRFKEEKKDKDNEKEKDAQGKRIRPLSRTLRKVHVSSDLSFQEGYDSPAVSSPKLRVDEKEAMSGVVLERRGRTWKHALLRLDSGYLLCFAGREPSSPCKMLPLHICMVRPLKKTVFRVICATQYKLTFRAKDVAGMRKWVAEIQAGIAAALSSQVPSSASKKNCGKEVLATLYRDAANKKCADCGAPDPTWVSISLGALLCIECSGVHRSLGTHISKVRSFELDHWDDKAEFVEGLGNANVNSMYEAAVPPYVKKPDAESDRETREKYIIDKYVHKKFLRKNTPRNTLQPHSRQSSSLSSFSTLASQLPPGFTTTPTEYRPRTPDYTPTTHIGSNVFAKKVPYGTAAALHQGRRGSLGSIAQPQYRNTARRNSMHPRIM